MSLYRTDLGRARGLGSAKHGVGHFIAERGTGVALMLLSVWLVPFALRVAHGGYLAARDMLASPVNAALAILTLVVGLYHAMMGVRVIVEDYIERRSTKAILLLLNALIGWGAAAMGTVALLKLTFGSGS
ncbi:MAG: succinate dehydrogenase, hydrophobic membrane anchor protein [Alphaproteobacteria bacterium]|nr:succinate dehydrogenase, hydrophobic membrane anchor protein [Alphaproteobacteria bacterium]